MFLEHFTQKSFFRDAGHFLHSSVLVVEMNRPPQSVKELPILDNNFAQNLCLESVDRQSTCWLLKQSASNLCRTSLIALIGVLCYLQLGKKPILPLWLELQYFLLTMFFYVLIEIKGLFFE